MDRLPCLATAKSHAATTTAAALERLSVCAPSPPVPQVSNTGSYARLSLVARSRIVRASPTISAGRSPFIDRPTRNPATCAANATPPLPCELAVTAIVPALNSCIRNQKPRRTHAGSSITSQMMIHGMSVRTRDCG